MKNRRLNLSKTHQQPYESSSRMDDHDLVHDLDSKHDNNIDMDHGTDNESGVDNDNDDSINSIDHDRVYLGS
ncbi:hypothetical protein MKX07_008421 [Trichoderma sp. CBMAI-0711]|nr:hypothetical protein MKX07_008421 [Trichoderma sp. CBMAI-0711]